MINKINSEDMHKAQLTASSKTEIANELGIEPPRDGDWGNMSSRACGLIGGTKGGNEVRNAIEAFERNLID